MKCERPWGSWEVLGGGKNFKVKVVTVLPKKRLSLQRHSFRSENWFILKGTAKVILEDKVVFLEKKQSIIIEKNCAHRLENATDDILELIEVQSGEYLEEDDIERLEDDHGRVFKK